MTIPTALASYRVLAANTATKAFILQNTGEQSIWVDCGQAAAPGDSIQLFPGDAIDSTVPGFSIAADLNVFVETVGATVALKYS